MASFGSNFLNQKAPASIAAPAPRPQPTNPAPAVPVFQPQQQAVGGSGGGGGGAAAAPVAAPAAAPIVHPSLENYINSNFLYTGQQNQNDMNLQNFDAQTLKGRQDTVATQGLREHQLQQNLNDSGQANAEDLAGRGILRSGINFQNQDKINAQGAVQHNAIADLLTQFNGGRDSGRIAQQNANQQALDAKIQQLTQAFNTTNTVA